MSCSCVCEDVWLCCVCGEFDATGAELDEYTMPTRGNAAACRS